MSFDEIRGFGADMQIKSDTTQSERPWGAKKSDASWNTGKALKDEERLKYLAAATERAKSFLDKYWEEAGAKGIERGGVYTIKSEKFKVSGIELRSGKNATVVLHGGKSGFEPKEIRLNDSFWDNNVAEEAEEKNNE